MRYGKLNNKGSVIVSALVFLMIASAAFAIIFAAFAGNVDQNPILLDSYQAYFCAKSVHELLNEAINSGDLDSYCVLQELIDEDEETITCYYEPFELDCRVDVRNFLPKADSNISMNFNYLEYENLIEMSAEITVKYNGGSCCIRTRYFYSLDYGTWRCDSVYVG